MRVTNILASLFVATAASAQSVPEGIAPDAAAPEGCKTTSDGSFTIGVLNVNAIAKRSKSSVATAQDIVNGPLTCTIKSGILHDQSGRTGSVVANHQFQFDGPPQAGAIYTGGFSVCNNGSLAIGGTVRWWQCWSGDFYNLYDEWIGDQCTEIRIQTQYDSPPSSSQQNAVSSTSVQASSETDASASADASADASASTTGGVSETTSTPSGVVDSTLSGDSSFKTTASPTTGGASSSSTSRIADAPPANQGAASNMGTGATLAAVMAIVGAAMLL